MLDQIAIHLLRIPLVKPYRLSFGAVTHYEMIVAEITDRDGNSGLGEANIVTGYTDETLDDSWRTARAFAPTLAGLDTPAAKTAIQGLRKTHPFTASAFGTAVEMIEHHPALHIAQETRVPVLGLLSAESAPAIRDAFEQLLAEGYRTIKVKVGFDAAADIAFVQAVQDVVAGRAAIRIDANQGYTREQGIAFARAIAPDFIELFEQPCAADDWDAHLAVAKVARVPMMLDESIYGLADIERAAALKAAAFIKVKLMKLVTLEALTHSIERIRALGMRPVLGNGVACDLGCWLEACVARKHIDNAGEMNGWLKPQANLLQRAVPFKHGALILEPGYRPALDHDALKRFSVDHLLVEK
jgi:L-Ala-D/L-Glu epimerase